MKFPPMLQKPSDNDKNFIVKEDGGWNNCIRGNPRDPHLSVYSNCVGHAGGRYNMLWNLQMGKEGMHQLLLNCNAENFPERAKQLGLTLSDKPSLGAICVWRKGQAGNNSDGAGHVAIVEQMFSNNEIVCSESDYGGKPFSLRTRRNDNGNWGQNPPYYFRCFIPLPKEWNVINPVNRDETVDQIYVPAFSSYLRIRTSPDTSTTSNIIGACDEESYYNVDEIINVDGQSWGNTWYRINDCYVAGVNGVQFLPGKAYEKPSKVERDLKHTQIHIAEGLALKLRFAPSLSAKIMGLVDNNCYYNVVDDPINADGYLWFKIGNNAYCAMVDGVELHIQTEANDAEELKAKIAELQTKVCGLEEANKALGEQAAILDAIKGLVG